MSNREKIIMTGCYGNSTEDRMREIELNRYLDAIEAGDRRDERIGARVAELWESLASSYSAEKLDHDWEITINLGGPILTAIAYARQSGDTDFLLRSLSGMIEPKLKAIAINEEDDRG